MLGSEPAAVPGPLETLVQELPAALPIPECSLAAGVQELGGWARGQKGVRGPERCVCGPRESAPHRGHMLPVCVEHSES